MAFYYLLGVCFCW